jgi:hypothetical protein
MEAACVCSTPMAPTTRHRAGDVKVAASRSFPVSRPDSWAHGFHIDAWVWGSVRQHRSVQLRTHPSCGSNGANGSTKLTTAQYGSSRVLVVLGFILSRLRLFIRYVTSLPMWPRPRPELGERGGEGEASRTCQNANVSQTTSQNHALSLDIRMDTSIHVAHNRARPLSCRADALLG